MREYETVIVGGGQAGLATSYYLKQYGCEHVVLERAAQSANVWRTERWDSFAMVTPNRALRMPGAEYNGEEMDGFMSRDEIIAYFAEYIERFELPIRYNMPVLSVDAVDSLGFRIQTPERSYMARNVVMATGYYQHPKLPPFAANLPQKCTQLHSSAYRNAQSLPAGAVLVVGSGQSGCQIAEELHQQGRKVFLSTGSAGRAPRRYRGKDIIEWLDLTGFLDLAPEQLPPTMGKGKGIPHLSGTNGGHTLSLHQFARDGITLLGHMRGAEGDTLWFAPDLYENLTKADQFTMNATKMIDGFIQAKGLNAPAESLPQPRDGFEQPIIEELDLKTAGISTIIWAMGYRCDYSLVKVPVFDEDGFPLQARGVTRHPGLYFVGLPWTPTQRQGFLIGVGESARHVAATIAATFATSEQERQTQGAQAAT